MGYPNQSRIEAAIERADGDFWSAVAESFPECTTGDFPPDATEAFHTAASAAIDEWLKWNHPTPAQTVTECIDSLLDGLGSDDPDERLEAMHSATIERTLRDARRLIVTHCGDEEGGESEAIQADRPMSASDYERLPEAAWRYLIAGWDTEQIRAALKRNDANGNFDICESTDDPLTREDLLDICAEIDAQDPGEFVRWLQDGQPVHGVRVAADGWKRG